MVALTALATTVDLSVAQAQVVERALFELALEHPTTDAAIRRANVAAVGGRLSFAKPAEWPRWFMGVVKQE